MKVLVINCGSSSLKYQLIDSVTEEMEAKGLCERIGIDGRLTHQTTGKDKYVVESPMPDHKAAMKLVMAALLDADHGVISSTDVATSRTKSMSCETSRIVPLYFWSASLSS